MPPFLAGWWNCCKCDNSVDPAKWDTTCACSHQKCYDCSETSYGDFVEYRDYIVPSRLSFTESTKSSPPTQATRVMETHIPPIHPSQDLSAPAPAHKDGQRNSMGSLSPREMDIAKKAIRHWREGTRFGLETSKSIRELPPKEMSISEKVIKLWRQKPISELKKPMPMSELSLKEVSIAKKFIKHWRQKSKARDETLKSTSELSPAEVDIANKVLRRWRQRSKAEIENPKWRNELLPKDAITAEEVLRRWMQNPTAEVAKSLSNLSSEEVSFAEKTSKLWIRNLSTRRNDNVYQDFDLRSDEGTLVASDALSSDGFDDGKSNVNPVNSSRDSFVDYLTRWVWFLPQNQRPKLGLTRVTWKCVGVL
jgi:hypothetical protein